MIYPPVSVCPSVHTLFPDNSSYTFDWIALKLAGQLDHDMVQWILFRGYSTPNDSIITLFMPPPSARCQGHIVLRLCVRAYVIPYVRIWSG